MSNFKVNDEVTGIVTGIESYGIFVNVDEYSGLIHISEISENFVRNVGDFAIVGDKIKVKVIEIDENNKHLKLSIKALSETKKKAKKEKIVETSTGFSSLQDNLEEWVNSKISEINKK